MYAKGGGQSYAQTQSVVRRLAVPLFLTTLKIVASPVAARLLGFLEPFNHRLGPTVECSVIGYSLA